MNRLTVAMQNRAVMLNFIADNPGTSVREIVAQGICRTSAAHYTVEICLGDGRLQRREAMRPEGGGLEYRYYAADVQLESQAGAMQARSGVMRLEPAPSPRGSVGRDPWDVALYGMGPARTVDYDALREVEA